MCVFDDLPLPIVAGLHALGQRMRDHVRAHRDQPFDSHEQGLLDAWYAERGGLLAGVVRAATTAADPEQGRPPRSACPQCGASRAAERWRPRTLQTRLGVVRFTRTTYQCRPCGQRWSRADQILGLVPAQRTSTGLLAWEARQAARTSFAEAATALAELTGVVVGTETLRTHAEQRGTALEAEHQAVQAHIEQTQEAPPALHDPAPGQLVVETDGVMVRYTCATTCGCTDGWHEVKLGVLGGWTGTRPDAHLTAPSYVAAREPATVFAHRLGTEATRRGALDVVGWEQPPGTDPRLAGVTGPALAVLRPVVVLGDGAKWIWEDVAPLFAQERIEIVDWFHGAEHVWDLATALHETDAPARTAWGTRAETVLWQEAAAGLLALLRETTAASPAAAQVLARERGYFTANVQRMRYPLFRQWGLPIGSGAAEGSAKHLVQQRMKRTAAMRWSPQGAHAVLQLRCHLLTEEARAYRAA
jgi:hypothetical protein